MQKPRISKNFLYIAIAVGMALLAAFVAVNYVQTTVAERTQDNRPMVEVAVPMDDMPQGAILQPGDLALRRIPAEYAPADAVTPENHGQFEGRMLRSPVRGGAPLSASALVPLYDQFSRLIPRGKVAYTLSVDENNSISGMIAPGDLIDILFLKDKDESSGARTGALALPLLQQVRVLATGTRIGERVAPDGRPADDGQGFSSVTLELDHGQAKTLAVASEAGSLRVLLRELEDDSPGPHDGLSERELMRSLGVGSGGTRGGGQRGVEFIIGGRG
ncbi:Flp pilus assembly protein CpaB [Pseudoxanthomonas suwonensis 11-1]|uniref:Flp pilus assembly protein CpaB n=1 Tax=Pseudoxanthomonas suwonensis (strain 11-1) TaxID=743721 RepID=E6WXD7_PSEUU|nr:Flp pilus assembly protein CpaB [Pseudoxanthomonas suwonensis]ADV28906.1 Flp pilus assembly protein CpaB [Pseudoxanthomonas suwonensis 11-1]